MTILTNFSELSLDVAIRLYEASEKFSVNFEIAWQWLGFSRKDSAKRKLVKHFVENEDYTIQTLHQVVERLTGSTEIVSEEIWLTVNCLKEMGMMAGTPKGKEVRNHFLQCEVIAKQSITVIPQLRQQLQDLQQQFSVLTAQVQSLLPISADFTPPGWDAEIWRQLPPQDKRHFRLKARRRRFRPDDQAPDVLSLPQASVEEMKQQQRREVEQLVGSVSDEEKARVEAAKQEMLARFYAEGGES